MIAAVLVLARTVHIGSAMLLVALPFFMLVILQPGLGAERGEGYSMFCRKIIKGLWLAFILEALSGLVWFWFVAAQMSDQSPWRILDSADLNAVLWQTQFGQLWLARAAIGVLLGVVLYFVSRRKSQPRPVIYPSNWLALAVSSILLATLAWAGHAVAGIHYHALHLAADILHLLLGSIWPIGLIPLGWFLWDAHQRNQPSLEDSEIGTLKRFSQFSLIAVLLLLITGFINGWLMIGSWNALFTTNYGLLLLIKVLAVMVMISLGAYNRLYLLPRIQEGRWFLLSLRRTVFAESLLALVVVSIVGIMGTTSPPF